MASELMPHIQLPADLNISCAVLPGDPGRVDRAAKRLEGAELLAFHREYKSVRGYFQGMPVLVISTGMGGPSAAIALEELKKTGVRAAVRIGSCGALQPELKVGDLVLINGAVRDEGTSLGYAPVAYPAVPDFELLCACAASAAGLEFPFHIGIGRSHDCLYADGNPHIYEQWSARHVLASDMETAALFVAGAMRGVKTASILNVVAPFQGRVEESIARYAAGETAEDGEEREILTAFHALLRIDEQMSLQIKSQ